MSDHALAVTQTVLALVGVVIAIVSVWLSLRQPRPTQGRGRVPYWSWAALLSIMVLMWVPMYLTRRQPQTGPASQALLLLAGIQRD